KGLFLTRTGKLCLTEQGHIKVDMFQKGRTVSLALFSFTGQEIYDLGLDFYPAERKLDYTARLSMDRYSKKTDESRTLRIIYCFCILLIFSKLLQKRKEACQNGV